MTCVTQTTVNLHPDTMAGYDPQKLSRTKAAASDFNSSHGASYTRGISGFSYRQTESTQGQNCESFWNESSEVQQCLHQDPSLSNGHTQNGISESFNSYQVAQDNEASQKTANSISGRSQTQWDAKISATQIESQEMSRLPSQDSIGARSQRSNHSSTANSYDQSRSTRMFPSLSQVSFQMSSASSDVTARSNSPDSSSLYTPTQQMDPQTFDTFPFPGEDDIPGANPVFQRNSASGISSHPMVGSLTAGPSYNMYAAAGDEVFMSSLTTGSNMLPSPGLVSRDSVAYNTSAIIESPILWDSGIDFLDSQRSSPIQTEGPWALHGPQVLNITTNSPLDYSPILEVLSPPIYVQELPEITDLPPHTNGNRVMRKPMGPRQSKKFSDLASASRHPHTAGTSETSLNESLKLFVGRSATDIDNNARVHHLYSSAAPNADGLYHCPWEGQDCCQHKPEKLKCNYDKFVDSHLKPYRCKVHSCETLQFSSTACLLRHEREAHAMHGHGEKPFLCTYKGCDRRVPGNGFPRHWNLRDHMRRVHNDPRQPKSNASGSPPPSGPPRGKKRKTGDRPDSPSVEKDRKRVPTPITVETTPRQPSLIEQYHETEQRLLDAVKLLHDPKNPNNIDLLRNASDCIKVMVQTTQRISTTPTMRQNFIQQSG